MEQIWATGTRTQLGGPRARPVPGILVRSTQNPCSKPYRMVDGAHRICRMKAAGKRGCFITDEATALSLVVPYPAHGAKAQRIKPIGRRGHRARLKLRGGRGHVGVMMRDENGQTGRLTAGGGILQQTRGGGLMTGRRGAPS